MNDNNDKSKVSNITSNRSFVIEDNLSREDVTFNVKPLNKEFSNINHLSKTLPLRKGS